MTYARKILLKIGPLFFHGSVEGNAGTRTNPFVVIRHTRGQTGVLASCAVLLDTWKYFMLVVGARFGHSVGRSSE